MVPKGVVNKTWGTCFRGGVAQRDIVTNDSEDENRIGMKKSKEKNNWLYKYFQPVEEQEKCKKDGK